MCFDHTHTHKVQFHYMWLRLQTDEQMRSNKCWTFYFVLNVWREKLIVPTLLKEWSLIEQTNLQCVCFCMQMPLHVATEVEKNNIAKYCCCCVSSILSSLLDIIWASYHCSDNGIKVEARTYFATKPNKIKILTGGFRTKIYVCIHTMMQSGFSIYICIF